MHLCNFLLSCARTLSPLALALIKVINIPDSMPFPLSHALLFSLSHSLLSDAWFYTQVVRRA